MFAHNDDLHPHETLSVQLYELCDNPSITVIQTACLWDNSYFNYRSVAPIINHNSVRGYVEVSFGVALLSPIVLCVCKRKNAEHHVPLYYYNTT